jgi:Na+-translocating ferredoxin:NAD+ oxidoreductase RnfC subunit
VALPTDTVRAARAAGIVLSDGRPLAWRLQQAAAVKKLKTVIASAADGEPLVATARRLAATAPGLLVQGLQEVAAQLGAKRAVIAVEDRAVELHRFEGAETVRVTDVARCGDASELAQDVAGVTVPPGDDPLDHGVLVLDAAALVDLAARGPVLERVVTVAGGVGRPGVMRIPIGTTVEEVVRAAGGSTCGAAWVALGDGPLTGRPLDRDDVITKGTRALFVGAAGSELVRRARTPVEDTMKRSLSACERCSMCTDSCPPRLLGGRLRADEVVRALAQLGRIDVREELGAALECQSCGLCDVACPSGLLPSALISGAAKLLSLGGHTHAPLTDGKVHALRFERRLARTLVARRLGLGDDPPDPPWDPWPFAPLSVAVPLKQSLGIAARPTVAAGASVTRGQVIATIPDDSVGVNMHAPVGGIVEEIAAGAIVIRAGATASPG